MAGKIVSATFNAGFVRDACWQLIIDLTTVASTYKSTYYVFINASYK